MLSTRNGDEIMTPKKLTLELCKREKLKKQTDIAQITEIVGHLADVIFEAISNDKVDFLDPLYKLGERRAKKRKKN